MIRARLGNSQSGPLSFLPRHTADPTPLSCARMTDQPGQPPAGITGAAMRPLSPAWPKAERISWYIFDAVILLPSLGGLVIKAAREFSPLLDGLLFLGWFLLAALMLWATLAYPQAAYRHAAIGVTPSGVEFRRGIWWRKTTIVPRSRVQHTDVSQGPLMRRFGLGKLVIHTAGTRHAIVEIPGLPFEQASHIRDLLLDTQAQVPPPTPPLETTPPSPQPDPEPTPDTPPERGDG